MRNSGDDDVPNHLERYPGTIVRCISKRAEIFTILRSNTKDAKIISGKKSTMAEEFPNITTTNAHPPKVDCRERSKKIRNPLTGKQREMANKFMESLGWIEFRSKNTREEAKRFCKENGIGGNQFKYWLEYTRKVRRNKGLSTK